MSMRLLLPVVALSVAFSPFARSADLADFPAGTRWALNIDLQAVQSAPLLGYIADKAVPPGVRRDVQRKLSAAGAMLGLNVLNDIAQVVIAGDGNATNGGVAYIYGNLDAQRLTTILAGNATFASAPESGFELLSWTDEKTGKPKYASFVRPGLSVMSDNREYLVEVLGVLAGTKAGLAADSPFKAVMAHSPQDVLSLLAVDLPSIAGYQPGAQALRQAQSVSLRVRAAQPDTLSIAATIKATSDETAVQIRQALTGIQALTQLRSAEAPEQASLAGLVKIAGEGTDVNVSFELSRSFVDDLVRQREARAAARAAAAAAANGAPTPAPASAN